MRSSRLLSILLRLQLQGRCSASELARLFEVSVRTIYRDVDGLSAAGVPVHAERGRHGGIVLREGYRARATALSAAEAQGLPLAGLGGVASDLGLGPEAASAQLKLLASLPLEGGADALAKAQRMAERFHLDPLPWYGRAEALERLPLLAAALWHDQALSLSYAAWRGERQLRVAPLGLVLKGGLWYLVAQAAGRTRHFRVSSILSMDVLAESVPRPRRFELADYWRKAVQRFEAELMCERARVKISDEGLRLLRAQSPAMSEHAQQSLRKTAQPGWFEAELPIEAAPYSARQLLRLGSELIVLSPKTLREALVAEAAAVLALYAKKATGSRV